MPEQEVSDDALKKELLFSAVFITSAISWLATDRYESMALKFGWSLIMIILIVRWLNLESKFSLLGIFLFGLCLRLYSQSFGGFEMLQWQDQVQDYLVLNTFMENGEISILPEIGYTELSTYYSSWPLLHALEIGLATLTGMSNFNVVIFTTFYLYFCSFVVVYCSVSKIMQELGLSDRACYLGMLVAILLPELIFWQSQSVRQNIGMFLYFLIIFIVLEISDPVFRFSLSKVLIIACIIQSAAHNFTSAITIFVLFSSYAIFIIISKSMDLESSRKTPYKWGHIFLSFAVISVATTLWWNLVGSIIVPFTNGVVGRFIEIILSSDFASGYTVPVNAVPEKLTPVELIGLLRARDLFLYGFVAIGYLRLFSEGEIRKLEFFAVHSSFVFTLGGFFVILFFWAEPERIVMFAVPFMAIGFGKILEDIGKRSESAMMVPVFLMLLGSLVSPWGHNSTPAFYYDEDLGGESQIFGDAQPGLRAMTKISNENYIEGGVIYTDLPEFALQDLDFEQALLLHKIRSGFSSPEELDEKKGIYLLYNSGYLFRHYAGETHRGAITFDGSVDEQALIQENLQHSPNTSKVIDAGDGRSAWIVY